MNIPLPTVQDIEQLDAAAASALLPSLAALLAVANLRAIPAPVQPLRGPGDDDELLTDAQVTSCLPLLVEYGIIRRRPTQGRAGQPGRTPSPVFDVNPKVLRNAPRNPQNPDKEWAGTETDRNAPRS